MKESLFQVTLSQCRQAPSQTFKLLLLGTCAALALDLLSFLFVVCVVFGLVVVGGAQVLGRLGSGMAYLVLFLSGLFCFAHLGFMMAGIAIMVLDGRLKALQKIPVLRILGLSGLLALLSLPLWLLVENLSRESNPLLWGVLILAFLLLALILPGLMLAVPGMIWGQGVWGFSKIGPGSQLGQLRRLTALFLLGLVVLLALAGMCAVALGQAVGVQPLLWLELIVVGILILVCLYLPLYAASLTFGTLFVIAPQSLDTRKWYLSPALGMALAGVALLLIGDAYYYARLVKLQQELEPRKAAQQAKNRYERPVLRGAALPGNGGDSYWAIIGKDKDGKDGLMLHFERNFPLLAPTLSKDKDSILEPETNLIRPAPMAKYLPAFKALQAAAQHSYIHHDYGFSVAAMLPNFITSQDLAKLMVARGLAQCQSGTGCGSGAELMLDVLRLGQDIEYRGTIIDGMVGIVIKRLMTQNALPLLTHARLELGDLRDLLAQMRILLASERNLANAFASDVLTIESEFLKLNSNSLPQELGVLGNLGVLSDNPAAQALLALSGPIFKPMLLDGINKLELQRERVEAIYRLPWHQQASQWLKLAQDLDPEIQSNPLVALAMPNYIGIQTRETHDQTRLRAAYLYLALETYHAEHGQYPQALAQLVPGVIPEVPADPWSGRPFGYKRLVTGDYLFYSVGPSGRDQGGKNYNEFDPNQKSCYTLDSQDNLVFSNRMVQDKNKKTKCQRLAI